jgi:hypothetical protein
MENLAAKTGDVGGVISPVSVRCGPSHAQRKSNLVSAPLASVSVALAVSVKRAFPNQGRRSCEPAPLAGAL